MDLKVGNTIYVNDSIGNAVIVDIQEDYIILLRDTGQFIKGNGYEIRYNKLIWNSGEYYNSLMELIQALEG